MFQVTVSGPILILLFDATNNITLDPDQKLWVEYGNFIAGGTFTFDWGNSANELYFSPESADVGAINSNFITDGADLVLVMG